MEGMLWKWTNYFSGWQPRWFVLEDGILSYYRSQDDINSSCKGSIKVSACDVSVHPTDLTRLDLIVPGEAHFYVKAANQHERQQWLIALGTTKACFGSACSVSSETTAGEFQTETLGSKKSELRLYCDLLMQQVYNVKMAVQDREHPNVELLNESTALLGATCDTFIKTLDDCVHLAHANQDTDSFGDQSPSYKDVSSPTHSRLSISISKAIPWNVGAVQRQTSTERFISPGSKSPGSKSHSKSKRSLTRTISETSDQNNLSSKSNSRSPNLVRSPSAASSKDAEQNGIQTDGPDDLVEVDDDLAAVNHSTDVDPLEVRLPTFFTALPVSFLDIRLTADLQIPTVQFLDACRSFLQIFDKLNLTALVPGKLDLAGNVKKIHQKYVSSPETFDTLQKMMISEMQCGQCHVLNSATIAILWLNRSLQFIQHVMLEILSDSDDVVLAANNAYKKTLMNYHGWVVRSAFSIAISSSPSKEDLMKCLSLDDTQSSHPAFAKSLKHDAQDLASALATLTHLLHNFFSQNKLDFPDQI